MDQNYQHELTATSV